MLDREDWAELLVLDRRYVQKSRTEHVCGNCRETIPVGSPYLRETILIDGVFEVHSQHRHQDCPAVLEYDLL